MDELGDKINKKYLDRHNVFHRQVSEWGIKVKYKEILERIWSSGLDIMKIEGLAYWLDILKLDESHFPCECMVMINSFKKTINFHPN